MENSIESSINSFVTARRHFNELHFVRARAEMLRYRFLVDYSLFSGEDKRSLGKPECSLIIATHNQDDAGLNNLQSLPQRLKGSYEVIIVDNSNSGRVKREMAKQSALVIESPFNFLASEGRNIGAWHARGKYLAFLDDDGDVDDDFVENALNVFSNGDAIAARGRIFAKTENGKVAKHYDLGSSPKTCSLNLEGNMIIASNVFRVVGGFDPLMFGHEGLELTDRCKRYFPDGKILYWPSMVMRHDFSQGAKAKQKAIRQAIGRQYLEQTRLLTKAGHDSYCLTANPFRGDQATPPEEIRQEGK